MEYKEQEVVEVVYDSRPGVNRPGGVARVVQVGSGNGALGGLVD